MSKKPASKKKGPEIEDAVFSSTKAQRLKKAPYLKNLFKQLHSHPITFFKLVAQHPFYGVRLIIGWTLWLIGSMFFVYTLVELIIKLIIQETIFLKFTDNWHINILQYIDKFLIFTTVVIVGEKITKATYEAAKKYIATEEPTSIFNIEFDNTVASMVVITIAIAFLAIVLQGGLLDRSVDIVNIGAGMGAIIVAIGLWSFLNSKSKKDKDTKK